VRSAEMALPVLLGVRSPLDNSLEPKPLPRREEDIYQWILLWGHWIPTLRGLCLCGEAGAARGDEGTDAEEDEDQAERAHDGLDFGGVRTGDGLSGGHFNDANDSGDGSEEAQKSNGYSDVHEEHTAFGVGRVGEGSEDGQEQAEGGGDERVRVMTEQDEGGCSESDEQDAEDDGELCQVGNSYFLRVLFFAASGVLACGRATFSADLWRVSADLR